jgi:methylenetetrahydrofolate reductase (NADPH)
MSPLFSFEFFPPKTPALEEKLWDVVRALAVYSPEFVSVTYGAGGTTRDATFRLTQALQHQFKLPTAAHLTCVGATRAEIDALVQQYWDAGIHRLVPLRGDAPKGSGTYIPHPNGYAFAADLIAGVRKIAHFTLSAAAYPETHPEALSPADDIANLKRKQDAGATNAITQFFFDNDVFFRFRDTAVKAGVTMPIIVGLLPIYDIQQVVRFATGCGASVPQKVQDLFANCTPETAIQRGTDFLKEQYHTLQQGGVEQFHIYTLNRAEIPVSLLSSLGVQKTQALQPEIA